MRHKFIEAGQITFLYDTEAKPLEQLFTGFMVNEIVPKEGADGPTLYEAIGITSGGQFMKLGQFKTKTSADKLIAGVIEDIEGQ